MHTMQVFINILFLCMGLEIASSSDPLVVQDWLTLTRQVQLGRQSKSNCVYMSDYFVMQQVSSGKNILPDGKPNDPADDEVMRIGNTSSTEGFWFKFVHVRGHLGYIEHYGGRAMHSTGNTHDPAESTVLLVYGSRHDGVLFAFDEENDLVVHLAGKYVQPSGGSTNPSEGTEMYLRSESPDAARFKMIPAPYPTPDLSGQWTQIFAVINPSSEQSFNINYKVGKSMTKQVTEMIYWKTCASIASAWFEADPEYNRYANMSEISTWAAEEDQTYLVEVGPGETSVIWQYLFFADRLDEQYTFRSSIVAENSDPFIPPEI